MSIKCISLGAAEEVTGSKHIFRIDDRMFMIDCGSFQGKRKESDEKNRNFDIDHESLEGVILTHGHLDHCGLLPVLTRKGWRGNIYATPATRDIANLVMMDSARIQAHDAEFLAKQAHKKGEKFYWKPLYDEIDCVNAANQIVSLSYNRKMFIAPDVQLEFYDAVAPIVKASSINMEIAFKSDRYGESGKGDYINCPMNKEEYENFVKELLAAERIDLSEMEKNAKKQFFSACQPVEIIAESGENSLRFGPLKPVGLTDPRTGHRPWAAVQLRQDDLLGSLYNMVGFQTNLKHGEQKRVFSMIPGLENAEFVRLGQMHRNSYINAPKVLLPTMQLKKDPNIFFAGQLSGVEGYTESAMIGLVAGLNAARIIQGKEPLVFPPQTMIGCLLNYITFEGHKDFHPMNINFGIFDNIENERSEVRKERIIKSARKAFREFINKI